MSRICVFDVNETLLDLRALDPLFERVFGAATVRQIWFTQVLQSAFVSTIVGSYRDFGTIGAAALTMVATRRGVSLSSEDQQAILGTMRRLPPYPEVRESLQRLQRAGRRMVALTNSTMQEEPISRQMAIRTKETLELVTIGHVSFRVDG